MISTPMCAIGLPSGPIENGTTYIVRPRMHPSKSPRSVARIFAGATQLFVGPASSSRSLQMNVRSSTRATSDGSERARKLPGRRCSSSRCSVPSATIASHKRSIFGIAAVAPNDQRRLSQIRDPPHPVEKASVAHG